MPINTKIQFRKGTETEWSNSNPVLASGEPGYVTNSNRFKIGDGVTSWNSLSYSSIVPSGFLAGSGINISLGSLGSSATIGVSGLNSTYISDFNSAVSGLLPVKNIVAGSGIIVSNSTGTFTISSSGGGGGATISNFSDNRLLTSDGTSTGINGESNLTFDGNRLTVIGSGLVSSVTGITPNALYHIYSSVSGASLLNVEGTNGSLFSVVDSLSGSLMSVNNNAGLPVFEVFSDDKIVGGRFNQNDLVVTSSGNVGLGTSSPSGKLHVIGSGIFASGLNIANQTASTIASFDSSKNVTSLSTSTYPSLTELSYVKGVTSAIQTQINSKQNTLTNPVTGTGIANHIAYWNSSSGIVADSGQLYWDDSNNRLGVGTSSPSFTIDSVGTINSSSYITANTDFRLGNNSFTRIGTPDDAGGFVGGYNVKISGTTPIHDSTGAISACHYATNAIRWFSNTSQSANSTALERMRLDNSGQLGIGTTTPSGQLHVVGTGIISSRLDVNNLRLDTNTLSSTNTDGNIIIKPNGAGALQKDSAGNSRGSYAVDWQTNSISNTRVASGSYSTIGGGTANTSSGYMSTVGGGARNANAGYIGTVGGGFYNTIASSSSMGIIGGGNNNFISGNYATIAGGDTSNAGGSWAFIGGGINNNASANYTTIVGGSGNAASAAFCSIGGGQNNSASITHCTIGGGKDNIAGGNSNVVGGGFSNACSGNYSTIGGGYNNTVSNGYSTIAGGRDHIASALNTTIGGGSSNTATAEGSTVGGGVANNATAIYAIVGGGFNNNAVATRGFIGGGQGNYGAGTYGVICGGINNQNSNYGCIVGGSGNLTNANFASIGGGQSNTASNTWSVVGGGLANTASGDRSTIGGGSSNTASAYYTTIAGGQNNFANVGYATIGGGLSNSCSSFFGTIGGGATNIVGAPYGAIVGGYRAKTTKYGEVSHGAGYFASEGDAQHSILVARRTTTDATANTVLFLDGSSSRLTIPAKTTWTFTIKISAYNDTDSQGGWWIIRGGIRRNGSNNTALIGSLITENGVESSLSTSSISVVADDTNEALEIRVTGVTSKNIRWVAVVDLSQVSYGTP